MASIARAGVPVGTARAAFPFGFAQRRAVALRPYSAGDAVHASGAEPRGTVASGARPSIVALASRLARPSALLSNVNLCLVMKADCDEVRGGDAIRRLESRRRHVRSVGKVEDFRHSPILVERVTGVGHLIRIRYHGFNETASRTRPHKSGNLPYRPVPTLIGNVIVTTESPFLLARHDPANRSRFPPFHAKLLLGHSNHRKNPPSASILLMVIKSVQKVMHRSSTTADINGMSGGLVYHGGNLLEGRPK